MSKLEKLSLSNALLRRRTRTVPVGVNNGSGVTPYTMVKYTPTRASRANGKLSAAIRVLVKGYGFFYPNKNPSAVYAAAKRVGVKVSAVRVDGGYMVCLAGDRK